MAPSLYAEVVALLKGAGWSFKRQAKGSHEIWWEPETGRSVSIPINVTVRHTANGILKSAGLPKAF